MTKKEEALKRIADRKAALAKLKESAQKAAEPNEPELVNPDQPNEPEPNEPESESPEVSEVEKEPIIWTNVVRKDYLDRIMIDERFAAVDPKVKGLKGIQLTGHQARDVHAMIQLENNPQVSCNQVMPAIYKDMIIKTHAGRLAEKYGSGKTIIILSLILLNQDLKPQPEVIYPNYDPGKSRRGQSYYGTGDFKGFSSSFIRIYDDFLDTTIIFVSHNVLQAWADIIANKTNLTCKVIDTIVRLREFEKEVNNPDKKKRYNRNITLVKNGISVTNGILGNPMKHTAKTPRRLDVPSKQPIIVSVSMILSAAQLPAKRVVVDDIDTMNLGAGTVWPLCGFFWSVSSTDRVPKFRSHESKHNDIKSALVNYHPLASNITTNGPLNEVFNISCDPDYTDKCCAIGTPEYYLYVVVNPNYNAAEILGALNLQNTAEIAEAFNAGSPDDGARIASKAAGIESAGPLDLLGQILGIHQKKYVKACKDLHYIRKLRKLIPKLPDAPDDGYPKDQLKALRHDIQSIKVRYSGAQIERLINTAEEHAEKTKAELGPALERAKENLKESTCLVCGDDFKDVDVVMTKCCNNTLCAKCGFHSTGIPQSKRLEGNCAKCRQRINIKSLIFIGKDFDIDEFITSADNIKDIKFDLTADKDEKTEEEICKSKKELIIKIIQKPDAIKHPRKRIDVQVKGLLLGDDELPAANAKSRKFVIFSNHSGILGEITSELIKCKIGYMLLQGTAKQRHEQIQIHKNDKKIKVLLLNSMKACAGIDMPYITDMIFCHEFMDKEIQGQASGRGQRMGRQNKMTYHYVLYDNEMKYFAHTDWVPKENKPKVAPQKGIVIKKGRRVTYDDLKKKPVEVVVNPPNPNNPNQPIREYDSEEEYTDD